MSSLSLDDVPAPKSRASPNPTLSHRPRDTRGAVPRAAHHRGRGPQHPQGLNTVHALNPTVLLAIPLLPLLAAVLAGLGGRLIGRAGAHTVTCLAVGVSC